MGACGRWCPYGPFTVPKVYSAFQRSGSPGGGSKHECILCRADATICRGADDGLPRGARAYLLQQLGAMASCAQKQVLAGLMSAGHALLEQARHLGEPSGASPRARGELEPQQAPHVVLPQLDVGAVDGLGLLDLALLEEQRAQDVPHGLHLSPGLVVGEVEAEVHAAAQVVEGRREVGGLPLGQELLVLDLALEDGGVDEQDAGPVRGVLVHQVVVEHPPARAGFFSASRKSTCSASASGTMPLEA